MQKNWNEAELNILKSYKEITYQEEQNLAKILKRSISPYRFYNHDWKN